MREKIRLEHPEEHEGLNVPKIMTALIRGKIKRGRIEVNKNSLTNYQVNNMKNMEEQAKLIEEIRMSELAEMDEIEKEWRHPIDEKIKQEKEGDLDQILKDENYEMKKMDMQDVGLI